MTTITTGFGSPGRGRYIHPYERRPISIREAGRVQAFPDWYWEKAVDLSLSRSNFQKIVGDAVPSLLVYPLMAALFA
jgi:DNA (cytosine-5)-methyltransferase 1